MLGAQQVGAILKRNVIEKKRNTRVTCCECCSHLFIILLLMYGYALSEVLFFDAETYSSIDITIPPSISDTLDILDGPLPVPSFDAFVGVSRLVNASGSGGNDILGLLSETSLGRRFGNLVNPGSLHFAPAGAEASSLVEYLNSTTALFGSMIYHTHDSESEAIDYIQDHLEEYTLALIVFPEQGTLSNSHIQYKIRQNYTTLPNTNEVVNWISIGLDTGYQKYLLSGFLTLQRTIDAWAFNYTQQELGTSDSSESGEGVCQQPQYWTLPFPTAAFDQNIFFQAVGFLLGLAMIMATMYPVSKLIKAVVEEKESKMREVMKIMGLRSWAHQLSWLLTALALFLWIALSSSVLCTSSFLPNSDPRLVFLFLATFCLSEITFSFLIASFFSKAKLAAIIGPVCLFCSILPRYIFFGTNRYEEQQSKYLASLLSPSAFSFGADILADYEYSGVGVQLHNMDDGLYTFRGCIQIMFFDFLCYGVLAWYFDQVVPGDVGTPLHPLFLFQKEYWCPGRGGVGEGEDGVEEALASHLQHPLSPPTSHVESISPEDQGSVRVLITGLCKLFGDGKYGVRHLSVAMLKDQITCLLGHNGAGKTTTISMLTGLTRASAGECVLWGRRLSRDLQSIREITGICPQQNVLFPFLTVEEHLYFFCRLKGIREMDIPAMVQTNLADVGLLDKRHTPTRALSGGMKRKTCLAIALAGDPLCVFLDEPTSGMDPYSRRSTWELLQKKKQGRVIILTTHFLEEAEILGDRIVIMSDGKLRCSGSTLFLKSKFGAGYVLTITRSAKSGVGNCGDGDSKVVGDRSSGCSDREGSAAGGVGTETSLVQVVQTFVPHAKVYSSIGLELVMELPADSSLHFPPLFAALKQFANPAQGEEGSGGGVASYGVQYVTLEQVFIRLAQQEQVYNDVENVRGGGEGEDGEHGSTYSSVNVIEEEKGICDGEIVCDGQIMVDSSSGSGAVEMVTLGVDSQDHVVDSNSGTSSPVKPSRVLPSTQDSAESGLLGPSPSPSHLVVIQLWELFRKRFIIASRDKKGLFFQILVPAIQIALVLAVLTISVNPAGRSLKMHADIYDDTVTAVFSDNVTLYQQGDVREWLSDHRMDFTSTNTTTSQEMSDYMLDTYTAPEGDRFGGYVYQDQIEMNVTVKWKWVQDNLGPLLDNADLLLPLLENAGVDLTGGRIDLGGFNNSFLADLNISSATPAVDNALDAIFGNRSSVVVNNVTIYRANFTDFIDDNAGFTGSGEGEVSYESLLVVDGEVVLVGVEITANNNTINLGNLTLGADDIAPLLPNQTVTYPLSVATNYSVLQNSTSPHAVGVFISELVTAAFVSCTGDPSAVYSLRNHPLPLTIEQAIEIRVILSVLASLFVLIPLCYIPASFVIFNVKERTSKSKHLQLVSGISPSLYWAASYMWDITMYLLLAGFVMLTFVLYGDEAAEVFIGTSESAWAVFLLLVCYGLASIPLSYLYSLAFDNHSTAQISIMTWNFFTGFVFVMAYYIMVSIPSTQKTAESVVHFFRIFPPYNIGEGLINISVNYFSIYVLETDTSYFAWEVTGRNLCFLGGQTVVYFLLVLLTELRWLHAVYGEVVRGYVKLATSRSRMGYEKLDRDRANSRNVDREVEGQREGTEDIEREEEEEDEDIATERMTVASSSPEDFILFIRGISKTFAPSLLTLGCGGKAKLAVRGVDLACAAGERFGLLGINGAGKTTTLGMLTGDIQPTSGAGFISGLPLSHPDTRHLIGFCPQTDPLLELMTGYETLWFFGRVRGLPSEELHKRCLELIGQVGLTAHASKPCGTYSGGNKRKLSLAVALIGNPRVLFLDEPSTGMDATAKRQMWDLINQVSTERSVVLTTHSMEECEAICSRIGIMVDGRLRCLGSSHHLKSKFGASYEVNIRCPEDRRAWCIEKLLGDLCNGVGDGERVVGEVEEEHRSYFRLKLGHLVDLSMAFSLLESLKSCGDLFEYSLSQSSLEQIFINFARQQEGEELEE